MTDLALKIGAAFEVVQIARLQLGNEPITEFHPFLHAGEGRTKRYRDLMTLFVAILAVSRFYAFKTQDAKVRKLTWMIHLLEVAFFYNEFKQIKKPTPKQLAFGGAVLVLPSLLTLEVAFGRRK